MNINDNIFDNDTDILSLLDIMLDFNENITNDECSTRDFFDNDNNDFNNNADLTDNHNDYNNMEVLSDSSEIPDISDLEPQFDDVSPEDDYWFDDYDDFYSNPIGIEDLFNMIWKE